MDTHDEGHALVVPPPLIELLVERISEQVAARPAAPEAWVGVAEVAAHLGCRPQRIYDFVSRRASSGIPHRKEGERLLFKLSAIDAWIESGAAA